MSSRLPVLRGDCERGGELYERPCPHTSCRYHLAEPRGRSGRPTTVVRDDSETCALDVADRGGVKLERVGALLGVTRERARQIEVRALLKLSAAMRKMGRID